MTSISFPIRTDRMSRRLGLVSALALTVVLGGCWPNSDDNAAKDNKMSPMASSSQMAPQSPPAASGASAMASATPQSEGAVVAKVNGVEIREGDIKLAEEDIGQQMAQVPPESKRDYLVQYAGDMVLMTQAPDAQKIADSADFKQQLEYTRKKLLMAKLLDTEAKKAATEDAMRKVYDDATKQMQPEEEVHARHILVESEDEAKAVREELQKGANFAELAKSKSKDPSAQAEGGDLGFFTKDQMVPEFAEAAFKLEKGQISEPVKSSFGWHIIQVEEKRMRPLPDYEQVKPQIQQFVVRKAQSEYLAKLREGAKIERLDKTETPAAATPPAAAPSAPAPADKPAEAK
jgi:peptidyl-prolyl cis-trans isomerase C